MATFVKPIYHLPSFSLEYMSPTEYCKSLTFLPDETPLDPDALKEWSGTPWGHKRTPIRPAVARALHYDSIPDFDIDFTNTGHPRQPKTKCAIIGSERRISEKEFASKEITSIKLASAKLTKPKVSKFAKWFEPSKPHGETATGNLVDESSHTATVTVTDTPSPKQTRSRGNFIRPKVEHYGDMSNLRPDDRGMDAATSVKFYRISMVDPDNLLSTANSDDSDASTVLESLKHLTTTDSNDSNASTSKKVTFDLGAQFAARSTAEQKAKVRDRAREILNEEAAALREKKEDEEDIPSFDDWLSFNHCPDAAANYYNADRHR